MRAPSPRQYELALDEIGLDWSGMPGAKVQPPAQSIVLIAGAAVLEGEGSHALLSVPKAATPADLLLIAEALKAANPGSEAHLVLYEPGSLKNRRTRQLLTRDVGLLMEKGVDPRGALPADLVTALRPAPGVPDGYLISASDPLAAVDLASALLLQPGVRSAYPLLKRYQVKR